MTQKTSVDFLHLLCKCGEEGQRTFLNTYLTKGLDHRFTFDKSLLESAHHGPQETLSSND